MQTPNASAPPSLTAELASRFGFRSLHRYSTRATSIFEGIDLRGKRVCDLGCGRGAWTVWCALHGATVVGLEPEADGLHTANPFEALKENVELAGVGDRVRCEHVLAEEFLETASEKFDVFVLWNVINHIAEDAVQTMHHDAAAWQLYAEKLRLFRRTINPGGWLIVADNMRSNFWHDILRRASPFAPRIEWDKHQDPSVWERVAREAGFRREDLSWSYLYPFKSITANYVVQYLTNSHFVLRFRPD